MNIPAKQLLHLPVETESGVRLGEVVGFDVNVEQHLVAHYVVKTSYLPRPFAAELVIGPAEVVSITAEKMVVEDAAVKAGQGVPNPAI